MVLRKSIVKILQRTGLNRFAHRLYYKHVHGFKSASSALPDILEKVFHKAADLGTLEKGDYYEFGIFKGYAFWWAQQVAGKHVVTDDTKFYGFDSFEGLPHVEGVDRTDSDDFYKGQYRCSLTDVKAALDKAGGVDWDRTVLTKGYFNESLTDELRDQHQMKPVAIALIDCDLYSSTLDVMRFIEPMVMDGSILIMDDWNCFDGDDDRGQRRAMNEFLSRNPQWRIDPIGEYGTWGKVFQLREKTAESPSIMSLTLVLGSDMCASLLCVMETGILVA